MLVEQADMGSNPIAIGEETRVLVVLMIPILEVRLLPSPSHEKMELYILNKFIFIYTVKLSLILARLEGLEPA